MTPGASLDARQEPDPRDAGEPLSWRTRMPLTRALLDVTARGVSFATPGHRCGRSYTPQQ